MTDTFIYKRFSFLVLIALILGVLVAQSQQAASTASNPLKAEQGKTFEIPCEELELCHDESFKILTKRA